MHIYEAISADNYKVQYETKSSDEGCTKNIKREVDIEAEPEVVCY